MKMYVHEKPKPIKATRPKTSTELMLEEAAARQVIIDSINQTCAEMRAIQETLVFDIKARSSKPIEVTQGQANVFWSIVWLNVGFLGLTIVYRLALLI